MTQASTDKGLSQTMQKAADTRVFTNAINAKRNKHKLGNPRVFIKRFLAICRIATTSSDTERLNLEVHDFVNSDLALFKSHQRTVSLQRASAGGNVATLKRKQDELQGQIQVVEDQIESRKVELQESKLHKQNQEEYEQIKGMIVTYPKRSESRAAIDKVAADILCLEQENQRLDSSLAVCGRLQCTDLIFCTVCTELRRKQFCQLGLLIREIAGDIDAPGVLPEEEDGQEEAAPLDAPTSENTPQPMDE